MKRRRILLRCLVLAAIGFVAVAILTAKKEPKSAVPLTVRFAGYTNSSAGHRAAILVISNHSSRDLSYSLHDVQQRGHEGWPQDLPWVGGLLVLRNLSPGAVTNEVVLFTDDHSVARVPVHFQIVPNWWERTVDRIRAVINARSLKPLLQPGGVRFLTFSAENFVFSDDLPPLDMHNPSGGIETHE